MFIWIEKLFLLVLFKPLSDWSPFPKRHSISTADSVLGLCSPQGHPSAHTASHSYLFAVHQTHSSLSPCSAIPSALVSLGFWSNPATHRGSPTHSCPPTLLYCPSFTDLSSVDPLEHNPLEDLEVSEVVLMNIWWSRKWVWGLVATCISTLCDTVGDVGLVKLQAEFCKQN